MARVKTFTNGGSLLPGDLNSIEDDFEFAFSTYKDLLVVPVTGGAGSSAGTWVFSMTGSVQLPPSPVGQPSATVYLDPADRTANTRTSKYRLRASCFTNAVAPTVTYVVGLYPIATYGGTSGNLVTIATLGAVVAGSTVTFTTPGASSQTQGNSGDFTAPAAGWYVVGFTLSGTPAVNNVTSLGVALQLRQV